MGRNFEICSLCKKEILGYGIGKSFYTYKLKTAKGYKYQCCYEHWRKEMENIDDEVKQRMA